MTNDQLLAAWKRKLPGVEPTDRELTAFALGVEVERERCAAIADTMRIEGAMPDSEESAQDWCARYIAGEIRVA